MTPPEVAQQDQRAGVGPVQVVEHEDDRCLLGQLADEAGQPVDQPHPLLVGLQPRVFPVPESARETGGQHRRQAGELPGVRGRCAHGAGRREGPEVAGDRLGERVERRLPLTFDAPPAQDRRAAPLGRGGELPQETGLADAGFTDDGHQPAAPGPGRGRAVEQPAQLALASDERGMVRRRWAGNRHGEQRRVVAQDPRVQVVEVGPGRDSELVGQRRSAGVERIEGFRLTTVAVQGQHQVGPASLPQRRTRDHDLQLAAQPSVSACVELEIDEVLARGLAQLVEPARLGLGEGPVGELAERRTPPQADRRAQGGSGGVRLPGSCGRPALRHEVVRAVRVHPTVSGLEPVTAGDRHDAHPVRRGERAP
jgi:hypothetical protein